MKKLLLAFSFLVLAGAGCATSASNEEMPLYRGSTTAIPSAKKLAVVKATNVYYPTVARINKEEGEVEVVFDVMEDGSVSNVRISKSSGFPRLDEAAYLGQQQVIYKEGQAGTYKTIFTFYRKDDL